MNNVTISLDDDLARWARDWAAQQNVSVSRVVGDLLRQRMVEEATGYESARERYLAREAAPLKADGRYPGREELHERELLR